MLFINTNSSLFAKEEAKGEEISEQSDKTRQPSSISYAPTQQALSGSIPPEETKDLPEGGCGGAEAGKGQRQCHVPKEPAFQIHCGAVLAPPGLQ